MLTLTIDEMPETNVRQAAIVEVRAANVDVLGTMDLLERLGLGARLPGFAWERDLDWLTVGDARTVLSINERSGGLRYRLRPLAEEPGDDVRASPSRLEQVARDFLETLGRPREPLHLERITYLRSQSADRDGTLTAQVALDAGLVFTRIIDELPVVGPGGMVMVKVGTDETVVGGREVWRPLASRGAPVPLRSADEALALLHTRLRQSGLDGKAHVRKARLGYAELGIEASQRRLTPCYAFLIETVGNLVESKRVEVIPAPRTGVAPSEFA